MAHQVVYLQRYTTGWKTVLTAKTNASGVYTFTLRPTVKVAYKLRAYVKATPGHAAVAVGQDDRHGGRPQPRPGHERS